VTARPPETPPLPARYELRRHIATGGMASVWCAHDALLGRSVAIKVLAAQLARDDRAIRRFEREARAAARLSGHPHVVTIYDVGEADGRPYIVMEHLAGGTVADAIRVGAVARGDAVRWLREAASALDYAHAHGVVHRDIKPGNLLLGADRTLYVADFGIAQLAAEDTLTSAGQLLGTANYLSPEQALGQAATDASDRYALAVAAFELLVGERPFSAEHFAAQARLHIEQEPPRASRRNRALPRAVDAVLARGMAKRPAERWPTARELVASLEAALGYSSTVAIRSPWRPRRAAAIAALVAACGAFAVVLATGRHSPPMRRRAVAAAITSTSGRAPRPARHGAVAHQPRSKLAPRTTTVTTTSTTQQAADRATAGALEARGHDLMLEGNYTRAIGVLHQAIAAAGPGNINYAYALYDLGRSLRLAGDPEAAIPVLERRLQIPNQTSVVLTELRLAQQAAQASGRGEAAGDGSATSAPAPPQSTPAPAAPGPPRRRREFHGLFASDASSSQGA